MLKRIKQIKNKRLIVADALLVAALVIAFAVTYDISKHAGLYLLSGEILVAAVRSNVFRFFGKEGRNDR